MTSTTNTEKKSDKLEIFTTLAIHHGGNFRFTEATTIKLGTAGKDEGKPTNLSEAIAEVYGGAIGASPLVIKAIATYNQIDNPNLVRAESEVKIPLRSKLIELVLDEANKHGKNPLSDDQREKITTLIESRMDEHSNKTQQAFLTANPEWESASR